MLSADTELVPSFCNVNLQLVSLLYHESALKSYRSSKLSAVFATVIGENGKNCYDL